MNNLFRIDDISLNTNPERLESFIESILEADSEAAIMLAVSPVVFEMNTGGGLLSAERVFPSILNAHSDPLVFAKGSRIGVPDFIDILRIKYPLEVVSHGLLHVDHRLLGRDAQELSIVMSCAISGSSTFVPPFNKWNRDTREICEKQNIHLVVWEEGWKHLAYNDFSPELRSEKYYIHTHDLTLDRFRERLRIGKA